MPTRKIISIISLLSIILFISSCKTLHLGAMSPSIVELKGTGFKIIKSIDGTASASYFMGVGGNDLNGLINEAKRNMYASYSLKENQTIGNVAIDNIHKTFFMITQVTIVISADVIEFNDSYKDAKYVITAETKDPDKKEVISVTLSGEEIKINNLKNNSKSETKYNNIDEVKLGDIVKFKNKYGEILFAIVIEKSTDKKVNVKTYPQPGNSFITEVTISELLKVE